VADRKELLLIEIREDGARVVKRRISDLGQTGDKTTGQMDKLKTVLAGLVSAKVIRDVIMLADSYTNMLNRLRVVTTGTWELHAAMSGIVQMSRETRTSLEANVEMYNRIAINTKQMGLVMEDVIRFSKQLNHAIILSGVTAREAHWGMVQFSQGLAAGALRGDELRAVMEQLPVVTQTLTKYLGIGRGELRKWAFEGRVTTKVIIAAFNDAEKSLSERFGRRIPTVDQALTVLSNSVTSFVGRIDQAIQGTGSLAQLLMHIADNMDHYGRLVIMAGTVMGSIFLRNLIKIVAQMKLFNLAWLKQMTYMTKIRLGLAGITLLLVVYSDKIKIANDSTATLADLFKVLGGRIVSMIKMLSRALKTLFGGSGIQADAKITLESILLDVAWFLDGFLGSFVGAGQVVKTVFQNIVHYSKLAWNGILSGIEWVKDVTIATFKSIGTVFRMFGINISLAFDTLAEASRQTMAGNYDAAKDYAAQSAKAFKDAATMGFESFSGILKHNLEKAASEDSLAGSKFEVEKAGKALGKAFWDGFHMSGAITGGLLSMLEEAKNQSKLKDDRDATSKVFNPSGIQNELVKDMLGNAGKLNLQMAELKELWEAINSGQEGTEGMNVTLDQVNRKMTELKLKAAEVSKSMFGGIERGFMKLELTITDFASVAEEAVTNAFSGMEDAMVDLATTGKANWKGLVDSILGDLTRLLTRMLTVWAVQTALGVPNVGGGGTLGGTFDNPMAVFGEPGGKRALGGYTSPGLSYMVGERGRPEIFTPSQPGTITPAEALTQPQVAEGDVTIINVWSEEAAIQAMQSAEGKRVIRNEVRAAKEGR
jgi:tape measure domain-containing protein